SSVRFRSPPLFFQKLTGYSALHHAASVANNVAASTHLPRFQPIACNAGVTKNQFITLDCSSSAIAIDRLYSSKGDFLRILSPKLPSPRRGAAVALQNAAGLRAA